MASMRLTDSAFGTVGVTITEAIDLADISSQLSSILGMTFSYDTLDVSAVTRTGLSAQGIGLPGSSITVGDFSLFVANGISGFSDFALNSQTIELNGFSYSIETGSLFSLQNESSIDFDSTVTSFDFSQSGSSGLEISVNSIAPNDTGPGSGQGYQVTGNDGDNIFYGFVEENLNYYGSNSFFAGDGDDGFSGGFGDELFEGGAGNDQIFGLDGDDTLLGYLQTPDPGIDPATVADNDLIFGGLGDDIVDGGPGNDLIYASQGLDMLAGGAGKDRFIFAEDYKIFSDVEVFDFFDGSAFYTIPADTGFGVSSVNAANTVTDFDFTSDLLVLNFKDSFFGEDNSVLIGYSHTADENLEFGQGDKLLLSVEIGDEGGLFVDSDYLVNELLGAALPTSLLVRVEQSASTGFFQNLALEGINVDAESGFFGVSFEVVYDTASQGYADLGEGFINVDEFYGFQVTPFQDDGVRGGQDKFDLTALELDSAGLSAIEDILFTTVDIGYGDDFTLNDFASDVTPVDAFFFDSDAGVNRAVHVEYDDQDRNFSSTIAVYVDADLDGNLDPVQDMIFIARDIQDGTGSLFDEFNPLTADQLYSDPDLDGGGNGIFIFNDDQYDFWFNDSAALPID